jgi:hypothetical protein
MLLRGLLIGALLMTAMAGTASAAAINLDQWYVFLWTGPVEFPASTCYGGCFPPQGVIDAPNNSPWTISGPITLRVLDISYPGEQLEVFDNGVSVGKTSAPGEGDGTFCGGGGTIIGVEDCWALPGFSKGTFDLGGGAHSINFFIANCPWEYCTGSAVFVAEPTVVPLPATAWLLLGTAVAGLGGRRWLRRKVTS